MSKLLIKIKPEYEEFEPDYLKGWREANSQFWVNKDKLFVVYDDDHDDEDEKGNHPFHDVSFKYDWRISERQP